MRDNGYAALIYIDIDGDATISGEQETTLVYVLSYDGRYVTTDNEVYHQYTVLNGDEEEDIVADNKITSNNDYYGVAHYLTRNSDGQLTDFQAATAGGSVIADTDKTSAISQSAGTLTIDGSRYLVTEDTAITLVTVGDLGDGRDASIMNKDEDADYEVAANISAKELVDALKGYAYTYDYAGKTSDNGKVLEELYVTVTQATEAAELGNDASIASITVKGETVAKLGDGETNTINLPATQNDQPKFVIKPNDAGAKVVVTKNGSTDVDADIQAQTTALGEGTYTIQVTSSDGSKTTTVTVEVEVAAASSGTLKVKDTISSSVMSISSKVITIASSANATVADLYAALEVDGGNAADYFEVVSPFGAIYGEKDTTAVTDSMTVVLHLDGAADATYTITLNS